MHLFNKFIYSEYDLSSTIFSSLKSQKKLLLTYINQHCFNIYVSDSGYQNLVDEKFVVYPDGMGIHLASRILFKKKYKQFNASDLNEFIINILIEKKIKFFIIGGDFNEEIIKQHFKSNLSYVGYNPGYFVDADLEKITGRISELKPDVIFIGIGVPKQEFLAEKLCYLVDVPVLICVGNFFEFYFGTVKRIPVGFRNKGIEWVYRMFREPGRLWKRYVIGIPLFIFRVIKYKFLLSNN